MNGLILCLAAATASADAQPIKPGTRPPEFDLPALGGGRVKLSKLQGHPVILSFWGTWCLPCRTEFPELIRVNGEHAQTGLRVIAINGRDQERNTKDVERFVEFFSTPFMVALDKRGSVRRAYRIEGQPTTVFIDSTGIVRKVHTGLISSTELDMGIALILPRSR